ncbi:MAG: hypothetical protein MJ252_28720, partial [archaeon]|nr:hypothetical protein [archaeon]
NTVNTPSTTNTVNPPNTSNNPTNIPNDTSNNIPPNNVSSENKPKEENILNTQSPIPKKENSFENEFTALNSWVNGDFLNIFKEMEKSTKYASDLISKITSPENSSSENKQKNQLDTFYNIKKLIPLLDKAGRLYIDISTYLNYSVQNNKLEELNKNLFQDFPNLNPLLRPYSQEEQVKVNQEILSSVSERTHRSGTYHFIPPANQYDRSMKNQIPNIDTPLAIYNSNSNGGPVDVYIHTVIGQNGRQQGDILGMLPDGGFFLPMLSRSRRQREPRQPREPREPRRQQNNSGNTNSTRVNSSGASFRAAFAEYANEHENNPPLPNQFSANENTPNPFRRNNPTRTVSNTGNNSGNQQQNSTQNNSAEGTQRNLFVSQISPRNPFLINRQVSIFDEFNPRTNNNTDVNSETATVGDIPNIPIVNPFLPKTQQTNTVPVSNPFLDKGNPFLSNPFTKSENKTEKKDEKEKEKKEEKPKEEKPKEENHSETNASSETKPKEESGEEKGDDNKEKKEDKNKDGDNSNEKK